MAILSKSEREEVIRRNSVNPKKFQQKFTIDYKETEGTWIGTMHVNNKHTTVVAGGNIERVAFAMRSAGAHQGNCRYLSRNNDIKGNTLPSLLGQILGGLL